MKKLLAIAMSLTFMVTAFSCGTKPKNSNTAVDEDTYSGELFYKEERFSLPENFQYSVKLEKVGDGFTLVYNSTDNKVCMAQYDKNINLISTSDLFDMPFSVSAFYDGDDFIVLVDERETDDEGIVGEGDFQLMTFTADGKLKDKKPLTNLEQHIGSDSGFVSCFLPCGDDKYVFETNGTLVYIDKNGKAVGSDDNSAMLNVLCSDKSLASVEMSMIYFRDSETGKKPSEPVHTPGNKIAGNCFTGNDTYKLFATVNNKLYGVTSDNQFEPVIDYSESLIDPSCFNQLIPLENHEYLAVGSDSGGKYLAKLVPSVNDKEYITLNVWTADDNSRYYDYSRDFAKQTGKYMVKFRTYDFDGDDIVKAVLTDEAPDIVYYDDMGTLRKLSNISALEDLTPYLDGESGINRDELLPNVVDAYTYKGGLYSMSCFEISYSFNIVPKSIIGETDHYWTFEEMRDLYEKQPETMSVSRYDYEPISVFSMLTYSNLPSILDYDTGEFLIDADKLTEYIEFSSNANFRGMTDFTSVSETNDFIFSLKKGYSMLEDAGFEMMPSNLTFINYGGLEYDDVELMYPLNTDGYLSGSSFSILSDSKNKEGAWEFISYMFECFTQSETPMLTASKKAFEEKFRQAKDNYNPDIFETSRMNDIPIEAKMLTPEQLDEIHDFMLNCRNYRYSDKSADEIFISEFNKYTAGSISARECAENIMSRMKLKLSEEE